MDSVKVGTSNCLGNGEPLQACRGGKGAVRIIANGTNNGNLSEMQNVHSDSDTDTAHSVDDCADSDKGMIDEDKELYADVHTGVHVIDEAMRQLNPRTYPKLTHPSLLLRCLKKDLEFPMKSLPITELVAEVQSSDNENERLYQLAMHLIYGKEIEQDIIYAVLLLRRVAKSNDVKWTDLAVGKAQATLAALHILGVGVIQSFFVGCYWYHHSLTNGNKSAAELRIATLHLFGLGTNKSWAAANERFKTLQIVEDPKIEIDLMDIYSGKGDITSAKQHLQNLQKNYSVHELESRGIKIQRLQEKLNSRRNELRHIKDEVDRFDNDNNLPHGGLLLEQRNERRLRAITEPYQTVSKHRIVDLAGNYEGWANFFRRLCFNALHGSPTAEVLLEGELNGFELLKYLTVKEHTDEDKRTMLSLCYGRVPYSHPWPDEILRSFIQILKEDIYTVVGKQKSSDLDMKWRVCVGFHQTLLSTEDKQLESFLKLTVERYPTEKAAYQVIGFYYERKGNFKEALEYALKGLSHHPQDLCLLSLKANNLNNISAINCADTSLSLSARRRATYEAAKACEEFLGLAPDCHLEAGVILENIRLLHASFLEGTTTNSGNKKGKTSLTWTNHCRKLRDAFHFLRAQITPPGTISDEILQLNKKLQAKALRIQTNKPMMNNNLDKAEKDTRKHEDLNDLEINRTKIITYHRERIKKTTPWNKRTRGRVNPIRGVEDFMPFVKKLPVSHVETDLVGLERKIHEDLKGLYILLTIIDDPYASKANIHLIAEDRMRRCCHVLLEGKARKDHALITNLRFGVRIIVLDPCISVNTLAGGKFLQVRLDDPKKCVESDVLNNACRYCLDTNAKYKCRNCEWAEYCNEECKDNDLKRQHKFVCRKKI